MLPVICGSKTVWFELPELAFPFRLYNYFIKSCYIKHHQSCYIICSYTVKVAALSHLTLPKATF